MRPLRLLSLALALAGASARTLHAQADDQLREAQRRYENLEIDRAKSLFQQVVSPTTPFVVTDAQRATAYKYLGAIYATLGQRDSAMTFFTAAIARDPLVDLDPRRFTPDERAVFTAAKQRVFRVGLQPVPRDTIDPSSQRVNITVSTTHAGLVAVQLAGADNEQRYLLFEGELDGTRDVPFTGLTPRGGGFIPPGVYDLVVNGESRVRSSLRDSTSVLVEISHIVAPLSDTIASLTPAQLLPERRPRSAAAKDLLYGVGIAAGALLSASIIGESDLNGSSTAATGIAVLGVGAGVWAFTYRRTHLEIPENMAENQRLKARRDRENAAIMAANQAKINATQIVIRPLGQ